MFGSFPRVGPGDTPSADAWNRLVDEVERLSKMTASPPLYMRPEASGYHLRLDPQTTSGGGGSLEVKTVNNGTGDSTVDVVGVTVIEIDQAGGLQLTNPGGGSTVEILAQPASGTHDGVVNLSNQVLGLGAKGFSVILLLVTPGSFGGSDLALARVAPYYTGAGSETNTLAVDVGISNAVYQGAVGARTIYLGDGGFGTVWRIHRDSGDGFYIDNVAGASRGTSNVIAYLSGGNFDAGNFTTPGSGWFQHTGGVFAGAGFSTLNSVPAVVNGATGTFTAGGHTLTITNGLVTNIT